jgi:hypothetical protein
VRISEDFPSLFGCIPDYESIVLLVNQHMALDLRARKV